MARLQNDQRLREGEGKRGETGNAGYPGVLWGVAVDGVAKQPTRVGTVFGALEDTPTAPLEAEVLDTGTVDNSDR